MPSYCSHPGEERLHPPLEREILLDVVGVPDPGGIDGAVQDHPADPSGEQRGVDLADIGAVGERVIVDLRHAERGPDGVQVAGDVLGGHVGQQPAELLLAVGGVGFRPVDEYLFGGGIGRDVVRAHAGEEAGIAAERGHRGPDAARVEAHDVVVGGHARAQALRHLGRERQPAGTGSARVDQHDPLLLALRRGGRDHVQGQADMPAAGIGVVDRDAQHGAVGHAVPGQLTRSRHASAACSARGRPARPPAACSRRCVPAVGAGAPGGRPGGRGGRGTGADPEQGGHDHVRAAAPRGERAPRRDIDMPPIMPGTSRCLAR